MSRVTVSDRWVVDGPERAVRKEILALLDEHGMVPVETDDGTIEATQGSQLRTRLLGGWFVDARHLPKRVRISLRETEEGIVVRARMEETLGFGVMDPILEKKYKTFFENWLAKLESAVT
jgi:hypothetical protein